MISEERGARSDEMVGGRPSIYRGLFNEFKMQLMVTGPPICPSSLCEADAGVSDTRDQILLSW